MKTKLVIFGITGDLAQRKLLPALAHVRAAGMCQDLEIIGVSRRDVTVNEILGECDDTLGEITSVYQMDLANSEDYHSLNTFLDQQEGDQVLFYLSVPPDSSAQIINNLGIAGLNKAMNKLLLEKPFGRDLESARAMIDSTAAHFSEAQVYRIDHYLAKEMAQNIVTFRARNALFAHLWNNQYIERIEVLALESIGIEGRAAFYEQTGALRDIVQGHLLQLLALTLLPLDETLDWDDVPSRRQAALDALQPVDPDMTRSVRAQYDGYRDEVNNHESIVETFVSLELRSTDPRWEGVPMALTTGKGLDTKKTEVRVHFKRTHDSQSNYLMFKIQPNEGICIDLVTKKPGYDQEVEHQKLSYMYPTDTRLPDAYEQVLVDAINGRKSLFATSGEVLRAWEILAPLQQAWQGDPNIKMYSVGSKAKDVITLQG